MENYENKELLKDAAKKSLESLKDLKPGTEEYNTAANMALKLYDMQLKDEAQENEKQLKEDEAVRKVHELELDQEKAEKARKLDWAKIGMDDEDHLRAACWNLLWALNQRVTHPELDDRFVPKMKSSNDEQLITVVCSSCGSHFEAPTEWWVRKRSQYTNIPDGAMTTCPHCGNVTIVREVKPDE